MRRGVAARRWGRATRRRGRAAGVTPREWGRVVGRCGVQEGRQGSRNAMWPVAFLSLLAMVAVHYHFDYGPTTGVPRP